MKTSKPSQNRIKSVCLAAILVCTASCSEQNKTASPAEESTVSAGDNELSDIKGIPGEKDIQLLNKLNVFDLDSTKFFPQSPISRSQFVKWLARAAATTSHHPVVLANKGPATFIDVSESDPNFKYIQGMANAGYLISYDDKIFRPSGALSREQMFGIKVQFDFARRLTRAVTKDEIRKIWKFQDVDKIAPRYLSAFYYDGEGNSAPKNVSRVYGNIQNLKPQIPVTRAEAAICLSRLGKSSCASTARADAQSTKRPLAGPTTSTSADSLDHPE